LIGSFKLSRHISYFVIQIYIPCLLVVSLSWIGFYINKKNTSDRCALGATSLLTMTILKMECNTDMPKISYLTALDFYLITCYGFVLFSILEFALIHQNESNSNSVMSVGKIRKTTNHQLCVRKNSKQKIIFLNRKSHQNSKPLNQIECLNRQRLNRFVHQSMAFSQRIGKIDRMAKYFFPVLFIIFNLIYFLYFIVKRKIKAEEIM
jgi:gamma-aminobutyric acid receptor subunit alpha